MASKIEWTDETWNPVVGCSKVSEGCANCYAKKVAWRLAHVPGAVGDKYSSVVQSYIMGGFHWLGKTAFVETAIEKPLHWKKPRMIFVCSMGDLFHESVPFEWIDWVFAVMALCGQHTFQVLTKRADRMLEYLTSKNRDCPPHAMEQFQKWSTKECMASWADTPDMPWPLPNVWMGVSAENQQRADEWIPSLLQCPAAVRFVSVEPMLGPIYIKKHIVKSAAFRALSRHYGPGGFDASGGQQEREIDRLDWVICGGESGAGARAMDVEWARALRDQCGAAGVSFFMKQMGGFPDKRHKLEDLPEDLRIRQLPGKDF